jgi:SAM-dependent methyltransferase
MNEIINEKTYKIILSSPRSGDFKRIVIVKTDKGFKCEKFTETQSFTEILTYNDTVTFTEKKFNENFRNLTAFDDKYEHSAKITKKGKILTSRKPFAAPISIEKINREKVYLLNEGEFIPPLFDIGLITETGAVKSDMRSKFRQLNRFIELIDDKIKNLPADSEIKIADFGCGKSYLSFALYYFLKEKCGLKPHFVCIDLKKDVIENCKKAAKKYGYDNMEFICGDIMNAENISADILITLHACDTATDFALRFAVKNGIKYIFSVPCCQHEINAQLNEKAMPLMLSHGIIKERFSAMLTDSLRAAYLTANGYKTQILEFTGFDDTPKNLLIRAEKTNIPKKEREAAKMAAKELIEKFVINPEIWK